MHDHDTTEIFETLVLLALVTAIVAISTLMLVIAGLLGTVLAVNSIYVLIIMVMWGRIKNVWTYFRGN